MGETYPEALLNPRSVDPYVMGILGNIGSGKTFLTNQLIQLWKFKFDVIVWISPTYLVQENSMMPRDATGIVVFDTFSKENIDIIKEHQESINMERLKNNNEKKKDPFSYMLLILDDNGMKTRTL